MIAKIGSQRIEDGNQQLSISVEGDTYVVSLSSWTDGIGWSCQKSIRLDAEQLKELHSLASELCEQIDSEAESKGLDSSEGNVIQFPSLL